MPVQWFRRLGDVPGLDYETPAGIERAVLPGHDVEPEVHRIELADGKVYESLSWPPTVEGPSGEEQPLDGSAPVQAYLRAFYAAEPQPLDRLIQRVGEALELPGRGSDYHFSLQQAIPELRSRMLEAPDVLSHIERLLWLDINLAVAYPQAVSTDMPEDSFRYYRMEAFDTLANLYSGEGFLNEALEVMRVAQHFEQGDHRLESLQERLATVRGEDAD